MLDDAAKKPQIIATGTRHVAEIRALAESHLEQWEWVNVDQVSSLLASQPCDLLVILCDRPGKIPSQLVAEWNVRLPNAPLVAVLASHCEGELRSGEPWPDVIRVYWHKWPYQFAKFQKQWRQHGSSDWHAARSSSSASPAAGRNEATLKFGPPLPGTNPFRVGISARERVDFEALQLLALQEYPGSAVWLERSPTKTANLDAILIEGDSWDERLSQRLAIWQRGYPATPKILLLGFPRADEIESASRQGIQRVLSKPLDNGELGWALHELRKGQLQPG